MTMLEEIAALTPSPFRSRVAPPPANDVRPPPPAPVAPAPMTDDVRRYASHTAQAGTPAGMARTFGGALIADKAQGFAETGQAFAQRVGIDYTVELRPLFLEGSEKPLDGHRATVRTDTGAPLGVVGDRYRPIQNRDALGTLDPLTVDGMAKWIGGGTFKGGAMAYGQVTLGNAGEVVPGDVLKGMLVVSNGHDGGRNMRVTATTVRVVCQNTLALAEAKGTRLFLARHTVAAAGKLDDIKRAVAALRADYESELEKLRFLAAKTMSDADAKRFLASMIPAPKPEDQKTRRAQDNWERQQRDIWDFVSRGQGTDIPGVRGTAWGLLNGVTEYVDHGQARDRKEPLEFALLGEGAALKSRAVEELLAFVR